MTAVVPWPKLKRPLIAILRGIAPEDAIGVTDLLIETGFEAIEVPLNSPEPFRSIESMAARFGGTCLIGAGTVLRTEDVVRLHDCGGRLVVSPNIDIHVVAQASDLNILSMPGVFTPSEAMIAFKAGASALKFFPASVLGASGIKAIGAVLPKNCIACAVGGVSEDDFSNYAKAGVCAFGLGSSLYQAGDGVADIRKRAQRTIAAYDRVFNGR